jgi:Protein of unknown function (DUF2829)
MDFGEAIRALKNGKRVARAGWNGKGMWLFLATTISTGLAHVDDYLPRTPSICMKTAQDTIIVGWLASQTDMLAEDWAIVE